MAYRLAKRAEADLEDIAYYIAKESGSLEPAGVSSSPSRTDFTCLGPIPTPAELETTICAQAAPGRPIYIIVYRVSGRDVLILRAAHSRRDIEALFGH